VQDPFPSRISSQVHVTLSSWVRCLVLWDILSRSLEAYSDQRAA
jgi:hypothetical protein